MPVTHGSTPESSDHPVSFTWTPPTLRELDAAEPPEGSVLSVALQRVSAELRDPRPVHATFDNGLMDPPTAAPI